MNNLSNMTATAGLLGFSHKILLIRFHPNTKYWYSYQYQTLVTSHEQRIMRRSSTRMRICKIVSRTHMETCFLVFLRCF
ncbi:unnamed protein product [Cylicocyclus nassatus]|uniref:Uncharacterized protein n=1 Tax=Cylicocyclus nassatus TaxID=53992 RepID=A0AA36M060_CYLNA|nr:unnamed protein product [Cylicocyclus nassatus]